MRPLFLVAVLALAALSGYLVLTEAVKVPAPVADAIHRTEVVAVEPAPEPVEREIRPVADQSPIQTRVQMRTYAVGGGTVGELLGSLQSGGPQLGEEVFFGLTLAETDLRFSTVELGDACELRDVRVILNLTVTLPEWDVPPDADPGLVRDWHRFRRALVDHENEHRRIAERGADALYRAVQGLRRTSCDQASADGRRRVDQLGIEVEAAHRRFDEETIHGRTQGAVWPLPHEG